MSEFLVIRLSPDPAEAARWVAVDETGALLGPPGEGDLAAATPAATGRQVIGLVPATDVLRTHAEVPVKGAAKILQALPFALEDQLAEDVDTLHFAAGSRAPDGTVPVAIVRRDRMDAWTGQFAAAGLHLHRLFAESDAIGGMPNTTMLVVEDDRAVLSEPNGAVAAVDASTVEALLDLWLAQSVPSGDVAAETAPRHLMVYCTRQLTAGLEPLWDRLRPAVTSLDVRTLGEDGALPRLAAQIVTAPGLNLLQGRYAQRSGLAAYWPAWRAAAALLGGFALLLIVAELAELQQLRAQSAALDQAIDQAFHYVFPDAGPLQDARAQFESRMKQLGSGNGRGSREFLDALRAVAQAMGNGEQTRIEALSFRSGVLELRLRAPTVDALDRIQQTVAKSGGLKAEIQSANASGNEVLGRIQITMAGS